MARSLLRSTCIGWFKRCRKSHFTSPRVPRQGSSPAYFRLEAASPLKRRSQGLSCVIGNFHAQFLEGWTPAMGAGYSVPLPTSNNPDSPDNGFGDWQFLVKYRIAAGNEEHGN